MRALKLAALLSMLLPMGARGAEMSGSGIQMTESSYASGMPVSGSGSGVVYTGVFMDSPSCGAEPDRMGADMLLLCGASATTLYSRVVANYVEPTSSATAVLIPPYAAPTDFDLMMNPNPIETPVRVSPSIILAANSRLSSMNGGYSVLPQGIVEMGLIKEDGTYHDGLLASPATLSLGYRDDDNDGVVDGSKVRSKTLRIWGLNEQQGIWARVPGSSVDSTAKRVSAAVPHFSVYALVGASDQEVSAVYAYPVPWSPNSGDPLLGNRVDGIRFANVPSEGRIRIFDLAGDLVRTLDIPAGTNGTVPWDVKTNGGRDAASGVYIWLVESGSNKKTGKLMVVR
ncbi:MAG: hypothetical protein WCU88_01040 [Elusimicrobiota bacterium]|jgi:hypothetical protein